MDDDVAFFQGQIASAGTMLLPSIRPLAVPIDGGRELGLAGSAVLVLYRSAQYLVSAAHVVEEYPERAYYIGTQTSWREIDGPWSVNRLTAGTKREADTIDVAFKKVDPEFATSLDGCRFLDVHEQAPEEQINFSPPYRSKYLVVGYPQNAFVFRRSTGSTVPQTLAFATTIASPKAHVDAKLNPNMNLVLDYEWDAVVSEKGTHRAPKLEGLSGGAIFRFPAIETSDSVLPPTLVGITIEERRQARLLIGTRLGVVHHLIASEGNTSRGEDDL